VRVLGQGCGGVEARMGKRRTQRGSVIINSRAVAATIRLPKNRELKGGTKGTTTERNKNEGGPRKERHTL